MTEIRYDFDPRRSPSRFARFVEWELTRGCNMKCAHCYNRPGTARAAELSTEEALKTAGFLASLGCESVSLSGGEPTLRRDWPGIAHALASRGVAVQILTNGLVFDRAQARAARLSGVSAVMLSLDGMEQTHDRIRRRPGGFHAVLAAADALRAEDVPFGFATTLLEPNLNDLEPLAELVTALGAFLWSVWVGIPRHPSDIWLSPRRVLRLGSRLRRLRKHCPVLTVGHNLAHLPGASSLLHAHACANGTSPTAARKKSACAFSGCAAGNEVLGLESDGTVTGCLALPPGEGVGNIRKQSLVTLWTYARWAHLERAERLSASCSACSHAERCRGGCHAVALTRSGFLDHPYCPFKIEKKPRHRIAQKAVSVAASVLMASSLAGSCATPPPERTFSPKPPPAAAESAEPVPSPPPLPAGSRAEAGAQSNTAPVSAPPPKTAPAAPPNRPWRPPSCCMAHVLVPGCVCSPSAVRAPASPSTVPGPASPSAVRAPDPKK